MFFLGGQCRMEWHLQSGLETAEVGVASPSQSEGCDSLYITTWYKLHPSLFHISCTSSCSCQHLEEIASQAVWQLWLLTSVATWIQMIQHDTSGICFRDLSQTMELLTTKHHSCSSSCSSMLFRDQKPRQRPAPSEEKTLGTNCVPPFSFPGPSSFAPLTGGLWGRQLSQANLGSFGNNVI